MIERDYLFWDSVASHEAVSPHIFMGTEPFSLKEIVGRELTMPLRSEHGGVLLLGLDGFGLVREMHTLYTPEGWGREVAMNGKLFMHEAFKTTQVIFTHEQEENWRSRPPKSHGWQSQGDFCYVGLTKRLKLWMLTRDAFYASPVGRKLCQ